ncbi:hypothetical protein GRI97_01300 [Altererythrobacter xixiisoli]|uniref:Uncharacterized protein n=1 Tax=Croceibacterium xixiisoli TaxID=1476466 RepID=A0A6I4TNV3_9SPHN|nr:TorF family putative porin [Croceibacterium xixiisoli]MXO97624.1 hypothetical protein [Croceibacterium xixiisoli]
MIYRIAAAAALLCVAMPAAAQEEAESEFTVSGSATLVSDYRFRGVSQSDEEMAIQGGVSVSHTSGFYAGTWASSLAGWGTFGGGSIELDLYGGFVYPVAEGVNLDVGVTWYMYPGGADTTDFAEPYVKLSGDVGPASVLVGVAYAPKQEALGNWYNHPDSAIGDKEDNFYIWGDVSSGIPGTPLTLKGHLGYSDGNPGLGPNGTSIAPTGSYLDWMLGADVAVGPLTLGVAYVDSNIDDYGYLGSGFASTKDGSSISGSQVVFSLSAGF